MHSLVNYLQTGTDQVCLESLSSSWEEIPAEAKGFWESPTSDINYLQILSGVHGIISAPYLGRATWKSGLF